MLVTSHAWILAILSWGPADVSVGQRADTCCDVIATNVNCPLDYSHFYHMPSLFISLAHRLRLAALPAMTLKPPEAVWPAGWLPTWPVWTDSASDTSTKLQVHATALALDL